METMPAEPLYRIAVLDDVPSTLRMTRLILEEHLPCTVDTYSRAEELVDLPDDKLPDLYILDVLMEDGMNGTDLCRLLKKRERTRLIPVFFFSAHGSPESRVEALQSGAADYIDKPFYPEELITRARIHLDLHRARRSILAQKEEQEALLRVLCHDLQNPIGAAFSMVELLQMHPDAAHFSQKTQDRLGLVRRAMTSALELIAHVREYRSLVDREQMYLTEKVPLKEAFEEVLMLNQNRADDKEVRIITRLPETELNLSINRTVLVHNLLNNLMSNAIKFSYPEGKILLEGWLSETAGKTPEICLSLTDNGTGMEPETVENLFDPTRNISHAGTRRETGTGFGMPLVKRYVDLFGGRIEISSKPHRPESASLAHGTTVRLFFPATSDA
jgi:two-component system, sensor histidine kinase and response regulator